MTSKRVIQKRINKDNSSTFKSNISRLQSNSFKEKVLPTTCITEPIFGKTLGSIVNPILKRIKENNGYKLQNGPDLQAFHNTMHASSSKDINIQLSNVNSTNMINDGGDNV